MITMDTYNCIIIDDEARARLLLEALIIDYCPQLKVMALCEDLAAGVKAIHKFKPELVFLDIEMPGHSGLDILDFFEPEHVNFKIIFTTAYSEYALQAFKFSAIDYLLKPLQHESLIGAVDRFVQAEQKYTQLQLKALQQNLNNRDQWMQKKLVLATSEGHHFIQPDDIVAIKGESSYSRFYLADGSTLLVSKNLKQFEDILEHLPAFFRCHKSYIVNLQHVKRFIKSDGGQLLLTAQFTALVSPDKSEEILARMSLSAP